MQWYYATNGQRQGPVTETEFERLVRDGVIRADTLVWRQGMPDWVPYSQVAPVAPPSGSAVTPILSGVSGAAGASVEDDTAVCVVSGKRYPKREMIQYEGEWVSAEHRDAFFQRMREGVSQPGELRWAGFWIRVLAKIIDGVALWAVALLIGQLFGANTTVPVSLEDPAALGEFMARQGLSMLVNIAVALLYSWFFLSRFQATPGKMALGLKVVRGDGSALSTSRIIGRHFSEYLSSLILGIGYLIVAFDDQKRGLHDHICDTRVIKTR